MKISVTYWLTPSTRLWIFNADVTKHTVKSSHSEAALIKPNKVCNPLNNKGRNRPRASFKRRCLITFEFALKRNISVKNFLILLNQLLLLENLLGLSNNPSLNVYLTYDLIINYWMCVIKLLLLFGTSCAINYFAFISWFKRKSGKFYSVVDVIWVRLDCRQ